MKFVITLGSDTVENKILKPICDVIEQKLQVLLGEKKYGSGVKEWEHAIYCDTFEFYKTNHKTMFFTKESMPNVIQGGKFETRRWIDSERVLKTDEKETYRFIAESILTPIYRLSRIKDFDYQAFRDDIISLFRQEGWISMQFFMTGETEATVGDKIDFFGPKSVVEKIKSAVSTNNYGSGISFWGHIIICCSPQFYDVGFFKEIKKYTQKDTEVELRLRIDYEAVLKGDKKEVDKLICESVLRGVDLAEHELKIKEFNFEGFRRDLISLFKKEGWI